MPNSNKNTTAPSSTPTSHHVRTFFASVFGVLAIYLIFTSIVTVWLNRTLTDTNTYVSTVAPLASNKDIQNFIAAKVSEQLVKNAPTVDLSNTVLSQNVIADKTDAQLKTLLQPTVNAQVLKVVQSPNFTALWVNTNRTAHQQLVEQLNSNSKQFSLNLNPMITGVLAQLKDTQLGPFANQIDVPADAGNVNLKGGAIDTARTNYHRFKDGTIAVVLLTLLFVGLAVGLSVNHKKTLRRMAFITGVASLLLALVLEAPSVVKIGNPDPLQQKAMSAVAHTLFHNLQLAAIVIGVVCLAGAIGSMIYDKVRSKK